MRAQHDALGKDVLAHLLEDEGTVEKERVVAPKDSQRIDLVFTPDEEKRAQRSPVPPCRHDADDVYVRAVLIIGVGDPGAAQSA